MTFPAATKFLSAPYVLFVRIIDNGHLGPLWLYVVVGKIRGYGKKILHPVFQIRKILVNGYEVK